LNSAGEGLIDEILSKYGDEIAEQVLVNARHWDEAAEAGFEQLARALDDGCLADLLTKYADDPDTLKQALPFLGKDADTVAQFLRDNMDEVVGLASRFGDDGIKALSIFKEEAISLFRNHSDDALLDLYLRGIMADPTTAARLADLKSAIPPPGKALEYLDLERGFEVRKMMQETGVSCDLHVTGRWSNTGVEQAIRREAAEDANRLWISYLDDQDIPQDVAELIADVRANPADWGVVDPDGLEKTIMDIKKIAAQRETAAQFDGLDWYQVKQSGWDDEIDVFINIDDWNVIDDSVQDEIIDELADIFNAPPHKVDFYQTLSYPPWKERLLSPTGIDRTTHIPPGSISFLGNGTIIKSLLGGLE
jgi:hypothetical protein